MPGNRRQLREMIAWSVAACSLVVAAFAVASDNAAEPKYAAAGEAETLVKAGVFKPRPIDDDES